MNLGADMRGLHVGVIHNWLPASQIEEALRQLPPSQRFLLVVVPPLQSEVSSLVKRLEDCPGWAGTAILDLDIWQFLGRPGLRTLIGTPRMLLSEIRLRRRLGRVLGRALDQLPALEEVARLHCGNFVLLDAVIQRLEPAMVVRYSHGLSDEVHVPRQLRQTKSEYRRQEVLRRIDRGLTGWTAISPIPAEFRSIVNLSANLPKAFCSRSGRVPRPENSGFKALFLLPPISPTAPNQTYRILVVTVADIIASHSRRHMAHDSVHVHIKAHPADERAGFTTYAKELISDLPHTLSTYYGLDSTVTPTDILPELYLADWADLIVGYRSTSLMIATHAGHPGLKAVEIEWKRALEIMRSEEQRCPTPQSSVLSWIDICIRELEFTDPVARDPQMGWPSDTPDWGRL